MSEVSHTPAPWQAVRSDPAEGADVWWIVGNTASHNQEKDIGSVQGGLSPTHEADARLIAAAPDLLAALIAAERLFEHTWAMNGTVHKQMKDAIAKAEEA